MATRENNMNGDDLDLELNGGGMTDLEEDNYKNHYIITFSNL